MRRLAVFFGDNIPMRRLASAEVLVFHAKTSSQPWNQSRCHRPRLLEKVSLTSPCDESISELLGGNMPFS